MEVSQRFHRATPLPVLPSLLFAVGCCFCEPLQAAGMVGTTRVES